MNELYLVVLWPIFLHTIGWRLSFLALGFCLVPLFHGVNILGFLTGLFDAPNALLVILSLSYVFGYFARINRARGLGMRCLCFYEGYMVVNARGYAFLALLCALVILSFMMYIPYNLYYVSPFYSLLLSVIFSAASFYLSRPLGVYMALSLCLFVISPSINALNFIIGAKLLLLCIYMLGYAFYKVSKYGIASSKRAQQRARGSNKTWLRGFEKGGENE